MQARHESFKAVHTLPLPSGPKQSGLKQPQPKKDLGTVNQSNVGESHPPSQAKRDVHGQVPSVPAATAAQRTPVLPITRMSMPMFQQPPVPIQFGGPTPQIQSQATSIQTPMPLSVGNATHVHQQVFVPSFQSHPLQSQGMMHQGQSLNFPPQMGHQLAPQLGSLGIGITPQFAQQQGGNLVGTRKAVKITHPETHKEVRFDEELRLDKRTDLHVDGGSSGSRHPNVHPQSQPVPSFTPSHQINYYPSIQQNPTIFFPSQASLPLTSTQTTPGSPVSRYNYPVGQGPQTASFMNPLSRNPLSTKIGPPVHNAPDLSTSERTQDVHPVASSAPLASVQVTLKPAAGSVGEKFGSSSVSVTLPVVSKGESPKLLRPPGEASSCHPQRDCDIGAESSDQQAISVPESSGSIPLSVTVKHSAIASAVSVQRPGPSASLVSAIPPEESLAIMTNNEGKKRETLRRSDSLKDRQKKLNKKDLRHSLPQHQVLNCVLISISYSSLPITSCTFDNL